jgi:hypothetical protein
MSAREFSLASLQRRRLLRHAGMLGTASALGVPLASLVTPVANAFAATATRVTLPFANGERDLIASRKSGP